MSAINKRQILTNIGSTWFSLGCDVLVGLFLSPIILHWLGDAAFGIWALIFSITGYYGLFDLGIRSSVVRYVSKFTATDNVEDLAKIVNTALFTYSCLGAVSLVLTGILSIYIDHIFRIPPELQGEARWLLLIVGVAVGVGFPMGVVGGYLDGLQRFYVNNWANITGDALRLGFILLAIHHQKGLLTIAAITVGAPLFTSLMRSFVAYHIRPVPLGFKYVSRATLRTIVNYSSVTLLIMVATQLKFKSDNVVIATMIGASAVTYFTIGSRIVSYAQQVVMAFAQNLLPIASQSEATGNMDRLRKVFVAGNRFSAFTALPITSILVILGQSIIQVWVGKKYVATSYPVLCILIASATLMWCQAASGRVLFGISKHRTWAFVTLGEGIFNLLLSITLVHYFQRSGHGPFYGIYGDALGTAIPLFCTMTLFMPWHLCRQLGIRMRTYLHEAYTLPVLITAPLVAVLLLMRRWYRPHNYKGLALQMAIGGVVYGLGVLWVFLSKRAFKVGELVSGEESGPIADGMSSPVGAYQEDA
ncbi:MAG TPA: oligosaccharide flippase family protein [Terriglobales bacterium]|nr:oligosaccharide flippase family protein [Terriglobales bacterium]